LVKPFG